MKEAKVNNKRPVVRLKAAAKEFNFSKLRADQDNKLANSGKTMFSDVNRMDFIINGKAIDKNFIIAFKEGAKHRKSELFNSDDIYNDEIFNKKGTREIDTDHGKFVTSVLEDIEKELVSDALGELWKDHCKNPTTADHRKTDAYKKDFEEFYNAGYGYIHLLPTERDENKNYRSFAKEVFKKIFRYAGAEIPSDAILEELITNCNQAGYEGAPSIETQLALGQSFIVATIKKVINIDCANQNNVRIRSDMKLPILSLKDHTYGSKICNMASSLEFIIESYDGEDFVTYGDGKLLLTIPEELKNYKDNGKSVFDIIKEYFQKFCAELGLKHETKIQIEHDLGTQIKVSHYLGGAISTRGSEANEECINLLRKNLRGRLLGSGVALGDEDVEDIIEVRVSTVMDLLSDYAKLEDNKENRELLISEVADNLGLFFQGKIASEVLKECDNEMLMHTKGIDNNIGQNIMELVSLPSLIRGHINHNQVQSVVNIFTKLIIEGKREIYEKKGAINAIDAIHQKVDKATKKQDIGNDKWTDRVKKQKLSVESHKHLH